MHVYEDVCTYVKVCVCTYVKMCVCVHSMFGMQCVHECRPVCVRVFMYGVQLCVLWVCMCTGVGDCKHVYISYSCFHQSNTQIVKSHGCPANNCPS